MTTIFGTVFYDNRQECSKARKVSNACDFFERKGYTIARV